MERHELEDIARIIERNLARMEEELSAYPDEESVWSVAPGTTNSAGTLALHMSGNLLHYVGALLGETGYIRDRDREFSERDVPRAELQARLREAASVVRDVFGSVPLERLRDTSEEFPERYRDRPFSFFVLHLTTHLSYHLGQVNYHRRFLSGD